VIFAYISRTPPAPAPAAETGFVATLDVTTNFYGAGVPTGDSDAVNFYSQWREAINQDPAIANKYPGVLLV
jgi:hypothetical protein